MILFEGIYKILAAYKYTWVFYCFLDEEGHVWDGLEVSG